MSLQQLMLVTSAIYFNMQGQGFHLWIAHQRPLHKIERERESALIREESDSGDIQSEEKKRINRRFNLLS
jgi:hypothetical protein